MKESTQGDRYATEPLKRTMNSRRNGLGKCGGKTGHLRDFIVLSMTLTGWDYIGKESVACTEEHGRLKTQLLTSGTSKVNI